jgi:hypothetical protein
MASEQEMRTRLTETFGIRHPILCAPMALVAGGGRCFQGGRSRGSRLRLRRYRADEPAIPLFWASMF